jgi:hypothetical protein
VFGKDQRHQQRPSLEGGLTLAQWDELYGHPAWERARRKLKRAAVIFGLVLLAPLTAIVLTYGSNQAAYPTRAVIAIVAMAALIGFVFCSGVLVMAWAIERFGDRPAVGEARSRRGKYKRRSC